MKRVWLWFGALLVVGALLIVWLSLPGQAQRGTVSDRQASVALAVAMQKIGAHYVWGSRGPDTFDSSGIYVYAYRQAMPNIEFQISGGFWPHYSSDARHQDVYDWNFQETALADLRPGDLVYISDGSAEVTHGMMFVEWVEPASVMRVLDASSRLMQVTTQDWPVGETVRTKNCVGGSSASQVSRRRFSPRARGAMSDVAQGRRIQAYDFI